MVTTRPPKTIVKPTTLGLVANTDTKLLIYGLFQKGRTLAQDAVENLTIPLGTGQEAASSRRPRTDHPVVSPTTNQPIASIPAANIVSPTTRSQRKVSSKGV